MYLFNHIDGGVLVLCLDKSVVFLEGTPLGIQCGGSNGGRDWGLLVIRERVETLKY